MKAWIVEHTGTIAEDSEPIRMKELPDPEPGKEEDGKILGLTGFGASAHIVLQTARHLWMEKEIKSVATITRADIRNFLSIVAVAGIRPEVEIVQFGNANQAFLDMKFKGGRGARVLQIHD